MGRPRPPQVGRRILTLALLGLFWVGIAPRASLAQGCHAPERPELALSFDFPGEGLLREILPIAVTETVQGTPKQVRPQPCSGEVPGQAPRAVPVPAPAILAPVPHVNTASVHFRAAERDSRPISAEIAPPERPPRP